MRAERIIKVTYSRPRIEHRPLLADYLLHRRLNIEVIQRLLDWETRIPLYQGPARTVFFWT
jgi:UDP-glucuronate decarboxylase